MIKIIITAIIALVLLVLIKDINRQFAVFITISVSILLISASYGNLKNILDEVNRLSEYVNGLNSYIKIMIKLFGISIIAQIVSSLCYDCGESSLAYQTQLYIKAAMLVIALPVFESVINIIVGLIK